MRHIPHLLVPAPWPSPTLGLREEQAHHLRRVLRLRSGATVTCTDGAGRFCEGRLEGNTVARTSESVVARPTPSLTVAVAPPHATARARFIVEKLVELGIDRLVWLQTRRGRRRPPQREKAQSWAAAALEQSRGCWLMEIMSPLSPASLVASGSTVVAEAGGMPLARHDGVSTILIGPEGGFTADEVPVSVPRAGRGQRVLRVETAAIVGATRLLSGLGRLSRSTPATVED